MKKSFIVLILWFFVPVYGFSSESHKVKNQEGPSDKKPQTSWSFKEYQEQRQKRQEKPNVPTRKPALADVPGLILSFHREPDEEETAIILQKATEEGLKRIKVSSFLKMWIFKWDKPKSLMIAELICLNFPKTPSLKHCEPNYPGQTADSSSQGQSTKLYRLHLKIPDVGLNGLRYFDVQATEKSYPLGIFPSAYTNQSYCDLFPDHSIYWAQRQIGVDLLREELKKKSRI